MVFTTQTATVLAPIAIFVEGCAITVAQVVERMRSNQLPVLISARRKLPLEKIIALRAR